MIASATKAEKQVTPLLDEIAREEGAELVGLEHRLKKADSLTDKITRDAATEYAHLPVGEAASRTADGVKDVLRYTVQSERSRYADAYDAVTTKLKDRGFNLEKVKNTWANPGSSQAGPYRGINSQWRTPDGHSFELQFHTPDSFAAKQETHAFYEEFRAPETAAARKQELFEIMTRMSDEIPVPPGAIW